MLKLFTVLLVLVVGISLTLSGVPSADATIGAGREIEPTQQNAYASYNNATNQVQVSWHFNTLPTDTVCLLKGDFVWHEDLNDKHTSGVRGVDYDKTNGFIPLFYSTVSSNPVNLVNGGDTAEVIPCENGSIRIDLDTIMNHSENINNYEDLEIFLTFYVANADGSFNNADASRIDEVFVMYTPNHVFDENAYRVYGCNGQIGSTLYVDASGSNGSVIAYGDNGDSCGDHLYVENDQWVDISMEPNDGTLTYGTHNAGEYELLKLVSHPSEQKKNSGGDSPPPPPTFGKNTNYKQIVENGFCFNGNCVDVDNYHTEYPLINATVGEVSNITVKAYNPSGGLNGFKWIQIILGMPEAGMSISEGEVINTFYLQQTEIDKVEIIDKQNLISNAIVSTSIVSCGDEFYSTDCLELSYDFIPQTKLKNNVVGINVVNYKNSGTTNFLNDGIEFHGESLLEPLISYVSASKGGAFYPQDRGVVELFLTSYHEDLWQDVYGYLWTSDNYKSFRIISDVPVPQKEPDLMWSAMTRINSNFAAMIIHEQERAVYIFDSSKLVSELGESWSYDAPKSLEEKQAELDLRISNEIQRVTPLTKDYTKNQHLYQQDSYDHWNYFGDMSIAEINQLDLEKKQRLQEEMLQQRLADKEQYSN